MSRTSKKRVDDGVLTTLYKDMFPSDELNLESILNSFVKSDIHLPLKSRIKHPESLAQLSLIAKVLKDMNFTFSSSIIYYLIERLRENWISENGERVKEIIEGLKGLVQYKQENQEKEGLFRRY